ASLPAGTDHAGAAGRRSPAAGHFRRDGTVRFS
ncbi:TPA: type IV secretion protein Rhs, partial [Escherichia coli]|nr:type IV secretion protein Rhs [Escherichia coli]EFN9502280.1 type IV secretion protein Rhs [Escherichia coli]EFO0014883.1 type IV secretion protein Rhs [Escherichia coli]HAJ2079104.1 type IV secretion protein Rhs [Escherichia coli]HAJ2093963.1 type IV secretion protein Rhs [Escherichia coli]